MKRRRAWQCSCSLLQLRPSGALPAGHRLSPPALPPLLPAAFVTMTSKEQRYAKMEMRGAQYVKHWKTDLLGATFASPGCELGVAAVRGGAGITAKAKFLGAFTRPFAPALVQSAAPPRSAPHACPTTCASVSCAAT